MMLLCVVAVDLNFAATVSITLLLFIYAYICSFFCLLVLVVELSSLSVCVFTKKLYIYPCL